MYFADHPPPHFHILGREGAAQVRIDTLEVIASSGRIDLREALAWAEGNRDFLASEVGRIKRRRAVILGKIKSAVALRRGKLTVEFDDGQRANLDLMPLIRKRANLAPLVNGETFQNVRVSEDGWSIEWPDAGIDFGVNQLRRWADEQSGRTMSSDSFREWMQRNKLTLDSAADSLGLSRRTVAYYLSGEQPVPKTVMLATKALEAWHFARM